MFFKKNKHKTVRTKLTFPLVKPQKKKNSILKFALFLLLIILLPSFTYASFKGYCYYSNYKNLEKASKLVDQGKYEDALNILNSSLEYYPPNNQKKRISAQRDKVVILKDSNENYTKGLGLCTAGDESGIAFLQKVSSDYPDFGRIQRIINDCHSFAGNTSANNSTSAANSNSKGTNNGSKTYTNSQGIVVESPDSNPIGATARCTDGTYSHSLNPQGTCSAHGGISSSGTSPTAPPPVSNNNGGENCVAYVNEITKGYQDSWDKYYSDAEERQAKTLADLYNSYASQGLENSSFYAAAVQSSNASFNQSMNSAFADFSKQLIDATAKYSCGTGKLTR